MSRYRIGARAEYKLKHEFQKYGWQVVRSAGSHGRWDLVAVRKAGDKLEVALIQVKRKLPPKKPIISVHPGSVVDCFIFLVPRKGAFLSKDWRFSVSDFDSIARQLQDRQPTSVCHRRRERTRPCRHDCHNESTHIRRRQAYSHSTKSSDHQEPQRGKSDESDRTQRGQL